MPQAPPRGHAPAMLARRPSMPDPRSRWDGRASRVEQQCPRELILTRSGLGKNCVLGCGRALMQLGRLHVTCSPTARAPSARCTCRAPLSRRWPQGPSQ
eukprot:3361707-Alexandrium_andersonii.AAC.2